MTDDERRAAFAMVGTRVEWDTERPDLRAMFGPVARGIVADVTALGLLLVRPDGYERALPSAWPHLAVDKVRKPAPMTGTCPRCGHHQ